MSNKYQKIKRTPSFIAAYSEMRAYLKRSSPMAYLALPSAMETILDVIDMHPRSWPIKRKLLAGVECEFHLAIINIAYRRLHIRYLVDNDGMSYLLATWVDGHDEPNYLPYQ
jgi:hypothetical protein